MEIGTVSKEGRRWLVTLPSGTQSTRTKREASALADAALADQRLREAAWEYLNRRDRRTHPDGKSDASRRWYPSSQESQSCCRGIRAPSRAYPWSYMTHCRTVAHIANLYDVDEPALRRLAR